MIRYQLQCGRGHAFEGWFGSSADYDDQQGRGLLQCPECGSARISKAIMAPSVRRAASPDPALSGPGPDASALREAIAQSCEDVGADFADTARAMFYGERAPAGIYGQATPDEARALRSEGIPAVPLPPALDPKRAASKLN